MELRGNPRHLAVGACWVIASFLLFEGICIWTLVPAPPEQGRFEQAIFPLSFVLVALLLTFGIAWILRGPELSASRRRALWLTFPLSIAGVCLGSLLVSVVVWREHWLELVEEIVGLK